MSSHSVEMCVGGDFVSEVFVVCRVVSAPGKVLITGAYLILEQPNAGLVLSTSARFYAVVKPIHVDLAPDSWSWVRFS